MSVKQLLDEIEQSSNLSHTSGEPLYRYEVTPTQLRSLGTMLSTALEMNEQLTTPDLGGFVLFASHNFCRTYQEGPWKWETALAGVPAAARLNSQRLYDFVSRGLKYWHRSVAWNGQWHEYLYTVCREGGLPLRVLEGSRGTHVERYLRELLRLVEQTRRPPEDIAPGVAACLPQSLQHHDVIRFTTMLIQAVVDVRDTVPHDCADPVIWLNQHSPDWQNQLPVRMSEGAAETLVQGLVRTARAGRQSTADFSISTELVRVSTDADTRATYVLERHLLGPRTMQASELARMTGSDEGDLPARVRFYVAFGDRMIPAAIGQRLDDQYAIRAAFAGALSEPNANVHQIDLVVTAGARELARRPIIGGEALGERSLPLSFLDTTLGERLRGCATGSHRSRNEALLALLPPGEVTCVDGEYRIVGEELELGCALVELRGRLKWTGTEDTCLLSTLHDQSDWEYTLQGQRARLGGGGEVWIGMPTFLERRGTGYWRQVPADQVEWRATAKEPKWRRIAMDTCGDIQLRVVRDGTTEFRTRAFVVPKDMKVSFAPRDAAGGLIVIEARTLTWAGAVDRTIEQQLTTNRGRSVVSVSAIQPPAEVLCRFEFSTGTGLECRLPYPSEALFIRGTGGVRVPEGARIGVDRLDAYTAVATSSRLNQEFILEAKSPRGWRTLGRLVEQSPGYWELPLTNVADAVESVLAGSRRLDDACPIRVVPRTGVFQGSTARSVRLGWHEMALDVEIGESNAIIRLAEADAVRLGPLSGALVVKAQPLHDPAVPAFELPKDPNGNWIFVPPRTGQWLVSGWVGPVLRVRPRLVAIGPERLTPELTAAILKDSNCIEAAMRELDGDLRRERLVNVMRQTEESFDHSAWPTLKAFLETLGTTPASTYDVITAIAARKLTATMALLTAPPSRFSAVWEGLGSLGVLWHTIPLGTWLVAAGRAVEFVDRHGDLLRHVGRNDLLRAQLSGLCDAREMPRFFPVLLGAISRSTPDLPRPAQDYLAICATRQRRQQMLALLAGEFRRLRLRTDSRQQYFPQAALFDVPSEHDEDHYIDRFALRGHPPFMNSVLVAPLLAAQTMCDCIAVTKELLNDIRFLRSFDEEWFDAAHAMALSVYLGERLEREEDYLERITRHVPEIDQ